MKNRSKVVATVSLPHPGRLLVIEELDYSNPYDFNALHRHDYFEIILVKSGEGEQLIDFSTYSMGSEQVFSIYPGQVHLMRRNTTTGLLIQFRKDIFEFMYPLKHHLLYTCSPVFDFSPDRNGNSFLPVVYSIFPKKIGKDGRTAFNFFCHCCAPDTSKHFGKL